jgi:hypothetical protein
MHKELLQPTRDYEDQGAYAQLFHVETQPFNSADETVTHIHDLHPDCVLCTHCCAHLLQH